MRVDFLRKTCLMKNHEFLVNGVESPFYVNAPIVQGYHYKAEFTTKEYDESKDADFLPPDL